MVKISVVIMKDIKSQKEPQYIRPRKKTGKGEQTSNIIVSADSLCLILEGLPHAWILLLLVFIFFLNAGKSVN